MKKELLLLSRHLEPALERLDSSIRVHRFLDAPDPEALLRDSGPDVSAVAGDVFAGVGADLMRRLPNLELVASLGVGYETIDMEYAAAHGITVTNTPDVLNDDVADLAIALMLCVFRRIPQADAYVRDGRWRQSPFPLTRKLTGARLGIFGLGRIGKAVAKRATAFDMRISYHGRHEQPDLTYRYFSDLAELACNVDVLVVLAPQTEHTRGMVNRAVLEGLGPEGVLINVARGSIVDEAVLVEMLERGELGGAGLDVFVDEPNVPEALSALDNVVLQPHTGSATHDTRRAMAMLVVDNLQAFFRGGPLLTPVN